MITLAFPGELVVSPDPGRFLEPAGGYQLIGIQVGGFQPLLKYLCYWLHGSPIN